MEFPELKPNALHLRPTSKRQKTQTEDATIQPDAHGRTQRRLSGGDVNVILEMIGNFTNPWGAVNKNSWHKSLHVAILVTNCTVLLVTFFVGIAANLFVACAVYHQKSLQTSTNALLVNLAVIDLLRCATDCPLLLVVALNADNTRDLGDLLCDGQVMSFSLSCCVQLFTLASISAERHQAVANPFKSAERRKRVKVWIPLTWAAAIALSALCAVFAKDSSVYIRCRALDWDAVKTYGSFGRYVLLPVWSVCLAVIVGFYSHIFFLVKAHNRKIFDKGTSAPAKKKALESKMKAGDGAEDKVGEDVTRAADGPERQACPGDPEGQKAVSLAAKSRQTLFTDTVIVKTEETLDYSTQQSLVPELQRTTSELIDLENADPAEKAHTERVSPQAETYNHSERNHPDPANHSERNHPDPANHSERNHPDPANHRERNHPDPANHRERNHPDPANHSERNHPDRANHGERNHPDPANHSERNHPDPANHGERNHPDPANHSDRNHPDPANHGERNHPDPANHGERNHPDLANHSERNHPHPADHSERNHPDPANHSERNHPDPANHSERNHPDPANHSERNHPDPANHSERNHPDPANHSERNHPDPANDDGEKPNTVPPKADGAQTASAGQTLEVVGEVCMMPSFANKDRSNKKKESKLAKRSGYIILTFVVFWTPLIGTVLLNTFLNRNQIWHLIEEVELLVVSIACMTSLTNPIMYAVVNPQFRTEFYSLKARCKARCRN